MRSLPRQKTGFPGLVLLSKVPGGRLEDSQARHFSSLPLRRTAGHDEHRKPACRQLQSSVEVIPIITRFSHPAGLRNGLLRQLARIEAAEATHPVVIWIIDNVPITLPTSSPVYSSLITLRKLAIETSLALGTGDAGLLEIFTLLYVLTYPCAKAMGTTSKNAVLRVTDGLRVDLELSQKTVTRMMALGMRVRADDIVAGG